METKNKESKTKIFSEEELKKRSERMSKMNIEKNKIEYQCPYCDQKIKSQGNLQIHINNRHFDKLSKEDQEKVLKKKEQRKKNAKKFKCSECEQIITNKGNLKQHLKNKHNKIPSEKEIEDMLIKK